MFDLETTGFSRNNHDIIEICAILIDSDGNVENEKEVCKPIDVALLSVDNTPTSRIDVVEDSDTDGESDLEESDVEMDEMDDIVDTTSGRWRLTTVFIPPPPSQH